MGFVKAEEFVNQYMRVNREIKEISRRKNEDFKSNIFIFYYNNIDSICTEHILHFHKNLKRDVNIYSYGIEKKEDILKIFKKYEDIYTRNVDYYRDYFFIVILIGVCSHVNTESSIYESIELFFSKILNKNYHAYLKFFVLDNKRPFHEIFSSSNKWDLVLSESEHNEVMNICAELSNEGDYNVHADTTTIDSIITNVITDQINTNTGTISTGITSNRGTKKSMKKLYDRYDVVKEENKCLCLLLYPFIQCISEDDSSAIIFIASISLMSYLRTDQVTYEYYNKEIKNLHMDSMNISSGHFISFDSERGLLPMLSFISLNESLEIDERIYIYDHKNVKNTFNQIRTMCHIEIKEFTGNFRQLDLHKQNEILLKLKSLIKIIKPLYTLGWKRRTYVLYNSDSFYFLIILIYIYINRVKKMDTYLYNCLKTSDFLFNIFKDRLKQSEIYDKLIEKHLHKNAATYLSVLIKKIMESNKKMISITSNFKIYMDMFQTAKNCYTHPFELRFIANIFCNFQSYCNDKYKTYHLLICHINDSDETILYGFSPLNRKDYWPLIFSKVAYSNIEQILYDTIADVNTMKIRKNDLKFVIDEVKDVFRGVLKLERKRELAPSPRSEGGDSFEEDLLGADDADEKDADAKEADEEEADEEEADEEEADEEEAHEEEADEEEADEEEADEEEADEEEADETAREAA
ncbi:conserved Plasmodium protein, unknown function [Plasmodium ovale]|uniref:Uncharacterized protein n=1 Tax=Plasmodium ovale TaxID=36330 RepID=A0A1D3RDC9_PLAOA|nr:conserved Plasmodium protein, unknown function [Plasmodium ovale]